MIVALTPESEWSEFLHDLPLWEAPMCCTVVIAPHPDDETLGPGGLIAGLRGRGVDVMVVAATNGENAYKDTDGLAEIRKVEQENALRCLGVAPDKIIRLELPDSDVAAHEEELTARLEPLITGGTHIVAPWSGDFHPDHEACGRAAVEVARRTGAALTSYFFWTWHRGIPDLLPASGLRSMKLNDDILAAKAKALKCHRSQLEHRSGEPILPASLLSPMQRKFEVFLVQ